MDGLNVYLYVGNNPINKYDPEGLNDTFGRSGIFWDYVMPDPLANIHLAQGQAATVFGTGNSAGVRALAAVGMVSATILAVTDVVPGKSGLQRGAVRGGEKLAERAAENTAELAAKKGAAAAEKLAEQGGEAVAKKGEATAARGVAKLEAGGSGAAEGPAAYRQGTFENPELDWPGNRVKGAEWSPEHPLTTPEYAKKYGLPAENSGKPDWVAKGRVEGEYSSGPAKPSRNAPQNTGGATEIRPKDPEQVQLDWFHMPDD